MLRVPRKKRNKPIITNIKSLTFDTDKCIDFMQNHLNRNSGYYFLFSFYCLV